MCYYSTYWSTNVDDCWDFEALGGGEVDYLNAADRYEMGLSRSIATTIATTSVAAVFTAAQERRSRRQTCWQFAALSIIKKRLERFGLDCDDVVICSACRKRNLDCDAGFGGRKDGETYYYD